MESTEEDLHIEGEETWKFPEGLPSWSRHSKSIKERYLNAFEFEVSGKKLIIKQANVIQAEDLGNTVWDGTLVLTKYFGNQKTFPSGYWKDKRVIELGGGTGMVGIYLALEGATVCLTDKDDQVPLMKSNVEVNCKDASVIVESLWWGRDVSHVNPPYDVIVASECIYYQELIEPLCQSMISLSNKDTVIYMSFEEHNDESVQFFNQTVSKYFTIEEVPKEDMDSEYQRDIVHVVKLKLK